MSKKTKSGYFHMRADEAWSRSVEIASEVLNENKTDLVEEGTRRYLNHLAKKNPKLKQALEEAAA